MESSLERSALLSKDITEQPESKYIVLLPALNIVLTAGAVRETASAIYVYEDVEAQNLIGLFSPRTPWACIVRDRVEIVSREQQIRRMLTNHKAEEKLAKEISPEQFTDEIGKSGEMNDIRTPGTGVYL